METSPLFECVIALRWHDLDANGHINNCAYFIYCEQARASFLDHLRQTHANAVSAEELMPVIVETQCSYQKALFYPGTIIVKMYPETMGNTSFSLRYEIVQQETKLCHAVAHSKTVCLSRASQKPIRVPEFIRQAFAAATQHD